MIQGLAGQVLCKGKKGEVQRIRGRLQDMEISFLVVEEDIGSEEKGRGIISRS